LKIPNDGKMKVWKKEKVENEIEKKKEQEGNWKEIN